MKTRKPVPRPSLTKQGSDIDTLLRSALRRASHPAVRRWLAALLRRGEVEKGGQK